ncbi:transcription initiation factor TFIID subunit 15-like isoform X2 [Mangifera indica]|uniref:transcription initiation factor TFIID subunit 15-like isoform X2 n=1 Tax=Mangifera indica TaxID=29780 RepID=UPI001CFA2F45|nr:transcription initiation factor TFIID subunit 15-like isoform X2 [Mangifera indica]
MGAVTVAVAANTSLAKFAVIHLQLIAPIGTLMSPHDIFSSFSNISRYRTRVGSVSPVRRRDVDHRYSSNFDHSRGMPHSHKFGSGRDHGRYRDPSPPYAQGRGGGRSFGRDFGGPALGPGPLRGEGMNRNNPNVRPREGDWTCPDPSCGNLNFARREYCNNCKRFRYAPVGSPRRGYSGPPPPPPLAPPSRRFSGPPMDISSDRPMNGFRSPPRGWGMSGHGPREFGAGGPPPSRHEGRFSDHMRRDRLDLPDYGYRGRNKPMPPMDWSHRDRGRDNFNERKGYDRRAPSPPPAALVPPHRGRWGQDMRERSRSPIRGAPPPKGYHQDMYMERGRNDGRGVRRDGIRNAY